MNNLFCPWEPAQYLIFSSNVPSILYYALIPGMVISLIFSLYIFLKDKKNISSILLLFMSSFFFIWGILDLILFATNDPSIVMFYWSIVILVEPLIYISAFYLAITFFNKKDITFYAKLAFGFLMLPIILILSTKYNLQGVNLSDCTAIESKFIIYYTYGLEILLSILIIFYAIKKFRKSKDLVYKKEIKYFTIGLALFLLTFSSGNIIGSFTDNWVVSQAGYFGMPIFVGFLGYLIVKYKSFNVKLLATQALVWGLAVLIGSQFFFIKIPINFVLNGITFVGIVIFGQILIKSVKKEVMQREQLQILTEQLFTANEKLKGLDKLKTEFLSLASHQLRSPLTAIKGYASMVLEGDFGEINQKAKEAIDRIFQSSQNLTIVVEDLLNVSKIEAGGMKYEMAQFSLGEVASDMAKDLSVTADKRGLKLTYTGDKNEDCMVNGDKEKIRQVVLNFIDNSIKYTKAGTIDVSVHKNGKKVVFAVKDTGMGMTSEIKATLFQKFTRGDGARMNTGGSGLGLYLAKEIVGAHKGRVWVDSEGVGKGSTFSMELDSIK